MTTQEAITLIDQALGSIQASRDVHIRLQEAMQQLQKALVEVEES